MLLPSRRRRTFRLLGLSCLLLCLPALSACGHKEANPTTADTEGQYVRAGNLTYQVQLSRQLNPYSTEDRAYLRGVSTTTPKPNQEWFVVFLWARNETKRNLITANNFDIVDTAGNRYHPVALDRGANPLAWTPTSLRPLGIQPAPDSLASFGPTQGEELLFKLNNSVYSNRPLTLEIYANGQSQPSSISLDL